MLKVLIFSMISVLFCACASDSTVGSEKTAASKTTDENQTEVSRQAGSSEVAATTPKGNQMNFDEKEYVLKRYDLNKNGEPDIVHVFKKVPDEKTGETLLRMYVKMMDLNHDSKFDVWRFFDIETGAISKEEMDFDFDGKIDRTDYFIAGVVRRSEFDSQFDENPDIIKSFDEKGVVVKVESDQNGDGKIDYWEFYKNGVLERIEKDNDNDGKSDVFKRMGDSGFTKIVDIDARFEMPEEPEENEPQPSEEIKAEEVKSENPETTAETEQPAEAAKPEAEAAKPEAEAAKPEAEAAKPEAEAAKPETEAAKPEAEPNQGQTSEKETK